MRANAENVVVYGSDGSLGKQHTLIHTTTEPFAAPMNQIPKVVFSRKAVLEPAAVATTRALEDLSRNREARGGRSASAVSSVVEEWARSRVAGGELAEEIAGLERASGRRSWRMDSWGST